MSGTMYRRQPTFSELIQGMAEGGAPPAAPQATGGMSPGAAGVLDSLEQEAFAPDPVMPEPAKMGLGQKIALALASGLGSYGAGLQGRGPVDYMTPELDRRTADRDREYALALRGAGQKRDAARFKIGRIEREQDLAADAAAKKEELAYRKTVAEQQAARDTAELAARAAEGEANRANQLKLEQMGNESRERVAAAERAIHEIRKKGEKDPQHDTYVQLKGAIVAKKREYDKALAEGTMTPDDIMAEWEDIRDAVDLDPKGPYAAAANAFFQDKIGPLLMKYAPQQGPANRPPPSRHEQLLNAFGLGRR